MIRALALALLAPLLAGCITGGGGSVAGSECKFLERPEYAVRGAKPYDQDWIDSTVEGGVGACKWRRPAARPAELDAPTPKAKPAAKVAPKKRRLLGIWPRKPVAPVTIVPDAPAPAPIALDPQPVAPPVPRSAVDELLHPSEWAK